MMEGKGILFNTEMVKAILENRKLQTRRLPRRKLGPSGCNIAWNGEEYYYEVFKPKYKIYKPDYKKGDILYVKETWTEYKISDNPEHNIIYRASIAEETAIPFKWKPSLFMPKKHARIWLEVTDVRVENIHEITEEDAKAEGIKWTFDFHELGTWDYGRSSAKRAFQDLWDSINKSRGYGWDLNPVVFAVSFKVIKK